MSPDLAFDFATIGITRLTSGTRCSTCTLNTYSCPGHIGHIELPVPVYHVTFMDQLVLLLKGKCEFCGHLKLAPVKVNRFVCKLRLIHHGLLKQSQELDDILSTPKSQSTEMPNGVSAHEDVSEAEESDEDDMIERLQQFVERAVKRAKYGENEGSRTAQKVGAIAEERRALVKEFLAAIKKAKICGRCKG